MQFYIFTLCIFILRPRLDLLLGWFWPSGHMFDIPVRSRWLVHKVYNIIITEVVSDSVTQILEVVHNIKCSTNQDKGWKL